MKSMFHKSACVGTDSLMHIRIISFDHKSSLVGRFQALFPTADVRIQPAIDVRATSESTLLRGGIIGHTVAHTLRFGRKWHHEFPRKGAVGLAHANRLALEEAPEEPLLLVEDDCSVVQPRVLVETVSRLLSRATTFDMAVFGMRYRGDPGNKVPASWAGDDWYEIRDNFWFLHLVLYTPAGRRNCAEILRKPLEMQIDSLYASYALYGGLRVMGHLATFPIALQLTLGSSCQRPCALCDREDTDRDWPAAVWFVGCLAVFVASGVWIDRCRRKC